MGRKTVGGGGGDLKRWDVTKKFKIIFIVGRVRSGPWIWGTYDSPSTDRKSIDGT